MSINLAEKYSKEIAGKFTHESFVQGNVSTDYDWSGDRTINIYTPQSVALNDYDRTASANRYGVTKEIQDSVQPMELTQDKGFSLAVDKGNNEDQEGIKSGAKMLKMEINEQAVPLMDKWAFSKFDYCAGKRVQVSAPTKTTIVGMLFDAATAMDNALVPAENRTCYMQSTYYNMLRQSSEFLAVDQLAAKSLTKGLVGMAADMQIIKVPDSYLSAYFLCTYKGSVIAPKKIRTAKIHNDVPGIDGVLLEGRYYFDAFVLGAKADGVYSAVASSALVAAPVVAISSNSASVTAVSGVTFHYTTDDSDPRYSKTAKVYAAAVTLSSGQMIKVAGKDTTGRWSAVTSQTNS